MCENSYCGVKAQTPGEKGPRVGLEDHSSGFKCFTFIVNACEKKRSEGVVKMMHKNLFKMLIMWEIRAHVHSDSLQGKLRD